MTISTKIAFTAIAFTFVFATADTVDAGCRSGRCATGSPARRPNYNFNSAPRRSSHNVSSYRRATPVYSAPAHRVQTRPSTPIFSTPVAPAPVRQTVVTQTAPQPVLNQQFPAQSPIAQPVIEQPILSSPQVLAPQSIAPVQPAATQPTTIQPASNNAADAALQALLG